MASRPDHDRVGRDLIEERLARLEEATAKHQHDLAIQFERIAQLQADLDAIRSAWMQVKPRRKSD